MRLPLLAFALIFLAQNLPGQNLVSNPDFETYSALPTGPGGYSLATGWSNCNGSGSPDYFHTQGMGIVQLPNCFIGTVNPNAGDGCMGGASYYYSPVDFREYLSSMLTSPLVIGNTYTVSLYVTNGVTSGTYGGGGIDQLSIAFSTQPLTQPGTGPIPVVPQVTFATVFYSYSWQLLSMQFVADSAYEYMTIGNFAADSSTSYQQFDPCSNWGAYYFYDDIIVEEASIAPVALFNAPNHLCPGTCIDFTNTSQGATSYVWTFPGANPPVSTDVNPTGICYSSPGNYTVELIATNSTTSDTLTLTNFITVYPFPSPQGIMQNGDTLVSNAGAVSYQWYHDGILIPGATEYFYVASVSGNYSVIATDVNGCEVEAAIIDIIAGTTLEGNFPGLGISLFPNPVTEKLVVSMQNGKKITAITVFGLLGEKVISSQNENAIIDCTALSQGIYILEIISAEKIYHLNFLKK